MEREGVRRGVRLGGAARALGGDHARAVEAVRAALAPIHGAAVRRELDAIPVARLQEVTEGRLRLGSVEKSGLRTVGSVLDAGAYRLRQIPGVGQRTADQMLAFRGESVVLSWHPASVVTLTEEPPMQSDDVPPTKE